MGEEEIRLFLSGDVMVGRGVDQIMRSPGDPVLHERWARSAEEYVRLAERHSGPIPRPVAPDYIWGEALRWLEQADVDARIINLETAITDRGEPWSGKGIHYRMHPGNAECLTAANIDVAVVANNHVLDWSLPGLYHTLEVLEELGIAAAGAGRTEEEAWQPAFVDAGDRRVAVLGVGAMSSGIPSSWAADGNRPGVALLLDLGDRTVELIASLLDDSTEPEDLIVVSVHWGSNWGYRIPKERRRFAHQLIDEAGVDVVHGHSSHHPLGMEVYRERPIIYGCGDLLTDYEGISGHEEYRGELGALYVATLDAHTGELDRLNLVPTEVERMRLAAPAGEDVHWLAQTLDREGATLGTRVTLDRDHSLEVGW